MCFIPISVTTRPWNQDDTFKNHCCCRAAHAHPGSNNNNNDNNGKDDDVKTIASKIDDIASKIYTWRNMYGEFELRFPIMYTTSTTKHFDTYDVCEVTLFLFIDGRKLLHEPSGLLEDVPIGCV